MATDEQVNYQQISYMTLMGGGELKAYVLYLTNVQGHERILKHYGVLYLLACTLCGGVGVCVRERKRERERDGEVDEL